MTEGKGRLAEGGRRRLAMAETEQEEACPEVIDVVEEEECRGEKRQVRGGGARYTRRGVFLWQLLVNETMVVVVVWWRLGGASDE